VSVLSESLVVQRKKEKAAKREKNAGMKAQVRQQETKERKAVHSDTQLMSPGADGRLMIVKPTCTFKSNAFRNF
jgi:hypothetical protein